MNDELLLTREGRVVTLTLNRPAQLNAFTPAMMGLLLQALRRCDADPGVGAVVLTGAGRGFCAGGDVKRMAGKPAAVDRAVAPAIDQAIEPADSVADPVARLRANMEVAALLHGLSKPTIAMVNGPAAGAGLSLALACDFRIAGASARLSTAFAKVGLPGDFGGSYFVTQLVGMARARELFMLSEAIGAEQALSWGLVTRVLPDAELARGTADFARQLAHGPTLTFGLMKKNLNAAAAAPLTDVMDMEARHQIAAGDTADHREAARAFVDKRAPVFTGR